MNRQERRERRCVELYRRHYRRAGVRERDDALYAAVESRINRGTRLLDAGCGARGEWISRYASRVARAVGVDLEIAPGPHPEGVELHQADLGRLPLPDASFDLVMSRSVLEHLKEPDAVFRELARVTCPGGTIVLTTPTKWDYGSVAARLTSSGFHRRFLQYIGSGEADYDNFPTYFRANTRCAILRLARQAGLRVEAIEGLSHPPYYLRFSATLYGLGIAYERFVSRMGWEELLGSWMITLRKA